MSGRRIADGGLAGQADGAIPPRPSESARFSAALASPRGVLIAIPLLVAFVGVSLTLVGQRALEKTSLSMARDRFVEQTAFAGERMAFALGKGDAVLDRVREMQKGRASADPADGLALVLRDLIAGRSGMTQVYVGYPDGTFQGVYIADDGLLRYQESRVGPGGGKFRHHTFSRSILVYEREEPTDYDPRKRAWWAVALRAGKRAWTEPYPFFTTRRTGVTQVEPIFTDSGELHSVIAVDFDVSALSSFMATAESADVHSLVFAEGGVVLAYPKAAAQIAKQKPTSHALNYRDIADPLLTAFFQVSSTRGEELGKDFTRFESERQSMLATMAPIGGAGLPRWHVAVLVSEQSFLRALTTHRRQSLLIAAVALVVAVLAAWVFARHIVRARRAVAVARAEADQASRAAMDLGSYKLLDCLGKGGMGEVWRAEHRLLAREAAIKLINADLVRAADREQIQERFRREAQTIASLRSRNTVELFDYGVTGDGTLFFVMELLDGTDLETLTEKHGPQPASRVVGLLVQVCNSLAEAHDAGLVHRDIKPANIFVCRAADEVDVVKVLDFGLVLAPAGQGAAALSSSKTASDGGPSRLPDSGSARLTQQGSYLGTPTFMPPEQAIGLEVDARADLYALGCVAWWLLTGRLVFPANDAMAALAAHMTHAPPPLRPLVSGALPAELEELILRCLSKNPSERPASARELAQALRAIPFVPGDAWTAEHGQAWWKRLAARSSGAPKAALGTMDTILSGKPTLPRERPA
ncbi:MAG TPA: protein kinase [Polyangiaceae bacterium]